MKTRNPSGMFARWIAIMLQYDFTVAYRQGRKHKNADALSHTPKREFEETDEDEDFIAYQGTSFKFRTPVPCWRPPQ